MYIGDADHVKRNLSPDPNAIIYFADFQNNVTLLVKYLQSLMNNQEAYKNHFKWRNTYKYNDYKMKNALLAKSWECRVCEWAINATMNNVVSHSQCKM